MFQMLALRPFPLLGRDSKPWRLGVRLGKVASLHLIILGDFGSFQVSIWGWNPFCFAVYIYIYTASYGHYGQWKAEKMLLKHEVLFSAQIFLGQSHMSRPQYGFPQSVVIIPKNFLVVLLTGYRWDGIICVYVYIYIYTCHKWGSKMLQVLIAGKWPQQYNHQVTGVLNTAHLHLDRSDFAESTLPALAVLWWGLVFHHRPC